MKTHVTTLLLLLTLLTLSPSLFAQTQAQTPPATAPAMSRAYIQGINLFGDKITLVLLPVSMQPVMRTNKNGKFPRVELDKFGKPELKEQPVKDGLHPWGKNVYVVTPANGILPKKDEIVTLYLVKSAAETRSRALVALSDAEAVAARAAP